MQVLHGNNKENSNCIRRFCCFVFFNEIYLFADLFYIASMYKFNI